MYIVMHFIKYLFVYLLIFIVICRKGPWLGIMLRRHCEVLRRHCVASQRAHGYEYIAKTLRSLIVATVSSPLKIDNCLPGASA